MVNARYSALPIVALVLKVLGFVVILGGMVMAAVYFISGTTEPLVQLGLMMDLKAENVARVVPGFWVGHLVPACKEFICTVIIGTLLIGTSEAIHVLMDIEENTRRSADAATKTTSNSTPRV